MRKVTFVYFCVVAQQPHSQPPTKRKIKEKAYVELSLLVTSAFDFDKHGLKSSCNGISVEASW